MAFSRAHYNFSASRPKPELGPPLKLNNLGLSIHVFKRGEGFDFFHNHREQEEVYLCLEGSADLIIRGKQPETLHLERGDVVRVDAQTLRAIGNQSSDRAVVLIAGACPHPYPSGFGHHDVIADVLSITGQGETGFQLPAGARRDTESLEDTDC